MLDGLWKSYQEGKLTDHQLQDLIDKLSDEGEDDDRSDPDPDTQADRPYHGEDDYAEETRNFSDWDLVHNNEENEHQLQRPVHKKNKNRRKVGDHRENYFDPENTKEVQIVDILDIFK